MTSNKVRCLTLTKKELQHLKMLCYDDYTEQSKIIIDYIDYELAMLEKEAKP